MVNPFVPLQPVPLGMRPTMRLRMLPINGCMPPGVPHMLARVGEGGGWIGHQLQQEWVSDDGTHREWRAIEVVL